MWTRKQSTLPSEATSTVCNSTTWGGDPSGGILRTWTVGVRMVGSVEAVILPISQWIGLRSMEAGTSMLFKCRLDRRRS